MVSLKKYAPGFVRSASGRVHSWYRKLFKREKPQNHEESEEPGAGPDEEPRVDATQSSSIDIPKRQHGEDPHNIWLGQTEVPNLMEQFAHRFNNARGEILFRQASPIQSDEWVTDSELSDAGLMVFGSMEDLHKV